MKISIADDNSVEFDFEDELDLLTMDEALTRIKQGFDEFEALALKVMADAFVKAGHAEADARCMVEKQTRLWRESQPARLETARLMLEARCAAIH
jgi:hypothetical protein